jgi:DNA-binding NarL/FixJ family response regulator
MIRTMPISVAIVDDHPLATTGLRNMLSVSEDIQVTDTYHNGTALLEGLHQRQPDVLLLDIQLPDIRGEELAARISREWPGVKMLAITSLDAPIHIKIMMRNGCKGYLLKNTDVDTLIMAIEEVQQGREFIEPALKEQMVQNILQFRKTDRKPPVLTRREREILELIVAECTNQDIAGKLSLSLRTVEKHRFSLLQKLDVKNTAGLVKTAIEFGYITH